MEKGSVSATEMYQWAKDLFPICRSITGNGVRETLQYLKKQVPALTIHEVPSGTQAFDWTVPEEWNIDDGYIADSTGKRVVDFKKNNLHVVSYSEPVDQELTFSELDAHLHSLPEQPDAIPYYTSYYVRRWGFCLTEIQRNQMRELARQNPNAKYRVVIRSRFSQGSLTYAECILPGKSKSEILISTYMCHPSLANNEISGPVVTTALLRWIQAKADRHYTYRVVFVPETIGSIVYLSRNLQEMKKNVVAGFVITCVGDNRGYSYVASRAENTLADYAAKRVIREHAPNAVMYTYLDRGSDERQYCAPGVDLPVCSVMRTKYGIYPEYHTSLDNLDLISPEGLQGGFEINRKCLEYLESNKVYRATTLCEPQLGRRGLKPTFGGVKIGTTFTSDLMNFLAYADGTMDVNQIAEKIGVKTQELEPVIDALLKAELMVRV